MEQVTSVNKKTLNMFFKLFNKVVQIKSLNRHSVTIPKIKIILALEMYPSAKNYNIYTLYRQRAGNKYCDIAIDLLRSKEDGNIYPVGFYDYEKVRQYIFWNKIRQDIYFFEINVQPALADFVNLMFYRYESFVKEV